MEERTEREPRIRQRRMEIYNIYINGVVICRGLNNSKRRFKIPIWLSWDVLLSQQKSILYTGYWKMDTMVVRRKRRTVVYVFVKSIVNILVQDQYFLRDAQHVFGFFSLNIRTHKNTFPHTYTQLMPPNSTITYTQSCIVYTDGELG